jgi:hypothetical protein
VIAAEADQGRDKQSPKMADDSFPIFARYLRALPADEHKLNRAYPP